MIFLRTLLLVLLVQGAGPAAWAQVFGKKTLVTALGGGAGALTFTQADGPSDVARASVLVSVGSRYAVGKRLSIGFRYDRIGVRRAIFNAGPSRTSSYQLGLYYVLVRRHRSDIDIGAGFGTATMALAAHSARLPREGRAGMFSLSGRWSRMLTPTIGFHVTGRWQVTSEEELRDEHGVMVDGQGTPVLVGFRSLSLESGLLIRF